MSCEIPGEVLQYITSVENDMPKACKEQHALAAYIRRVFAEEDIFVDTEKVQKYLRMAKYFPFESFSVGRVFVDALGLYIPEERDAKMEDAVLHGGTGKRKRRFYRI